MGCQVGVSAGRTGRQEESTRVACFSAFCFFSFKLARPHPASWPAPCWLSSTTTPLQPRPTPWPLWWHEERQNMSHNTRQAHRRAAAGATPAAASSPTFVGWHPALAATSKGPAEEDRKLAASSSSSWLRAAPQALPESLPTHSPPLCTALSTWVGLTSLAKAGHRRRPSWILPTSSPRSLGLIAGCKAWCESKWRQRPGWFSSGGARWCWLASVRRQVSGRA